MPFARTKKHMTLAFLTLFALLSAWQLLAPAKARAVEGGTSHYLVGAYGDFLMGYVPEQGLYLRNDTLYQSTHMDSNFRGGKIYAGVDATIITNITKASYMFEVPALGGFLGTGLGVPVIINEHIKGDVAVDYDRRSRSTGLDTEHQFTVGGGGDRGGLSDIFLMPVIGAWNFGECHLVVSPILFLPTGYYSSKKLTNLGLNYTSFDGNVAFSWLGKSNIELSVNAGYMINTENMTTHYLSGNQLHADWTVAYHVNERLALSAVGYLVAQTTPDSGPGAKTGGFWSSGTGIGPAITYTLPIGSQNLMLTGKWLHGLGAANAPVGDTVYASLGIKF